MGSPRILEPRGASVHGRQARFARSQLATRARLFALERGLHEPREERVRLRGAARVVGRGAGSGANLWLRVDRPEGQRGFFDNMADRPIRSDGWGDYEIVGEVAADATRVVFGGFLDGRGAAYFDDFSLAVQAADGSFTPVRVENPGFEAGVAGWSAKADGYVEAIVEDAKTKRELFAKLATMFPTQILASNTSSISITPLSARMTSSPMDSRSLVTRSRIAGSSSATMVLILMVLLLSCIMRATYISRDPWGIPEPAKIPAQGMQRPRPWEEGL